MSSKANLCPNLSQICESVITCVAWVLPKAIRQDYVDEQVSELDSLLEQGARQLIGFTVNALWSSLKWGTEVRLEHVRECVSQLVQLCLVRVVRFVLFYVIADALLRLAVEHSEDKPDNLPSRVRLNITCFLTSVHLAIVGVDAWEYLKNHQCEEGMPPFDM